MTDIIDTVAHEPELEIAANTADINSFVVVKYLGKMAPRYYVGQIVKRYSTEPPFKCQIRFMRKDKSSIENVFKWPDREDLDDYVPNEEIVQILTEPTLLRRGELSLKLTNFLRHLLLNKLITYLSRTVHCLVLS